MKREVSKMLAGRYRLQEVVGGGGGGTVASAYDSVLHRRVAVKLLKEELASDPRTVERFAREARIAAGLDHPGIAAVYDFGEEDGTSFIVMEFLEGEDLHTRLARSGSLDPRTAAEIAIEVADALAHAHERGAVHRDVKPGNIFITISGRTKITDFGIAHAAGQAPLTTSGNVLGTALYMAPEQIIGAEVGPPADIYSLGCVLFEMLTGRPPFRGDTATAISNAHLQRRAPMARTLNPDVPPEIDAIVARALRKEPNERYSSGGEMAAALRDAIGQPPGPSLFEASDVGRDPPPTITTGRRPSTDVLVAARPLPRPSRPKRPRLRRAIGWLSLIALVAAALITITSRVREPERVAVPDLIGKSVQAAGRLADRDGFRVQVRETEGTQPAGEIIAQQPAPQTLYGRGAVITVSVSSGNLAEVPSLLNLRLDDAKRRLLSAGLVPKVLTKGADDEDKVTRQSPQAGQLAAKGSTVEITILVGKRKGHGD